MDQNHEPSSYHPLTTPRISLINLFDLSSKRQTPITQEASLQLKGQSFQEKHVEEFYAQGVQLAKHPPELSALMFMP